MKLKQIFSFAFAFALAASALPAYAIIPVDVTGAHGDGTNIISSGTVYMIQNGQRRPYTSAGAFLSYGFNNWNGVVNATIGDLNLPVGSFIPPQDGKVMCSDRGSDKGTCYLITNSQKAGFVSEAVFKAHGYDFKNAMYGDISFLPSTSNIETTTEAHKPGTVINLNGTIYLVTGNGLLGFPNLDTFTSWGYATKDVVTANAADAALPIKNVVPGRALGLLNPGDAAKAETAVAVSNLTPSSGPVGTSVTIMGSGFTASGNKISFGISGGRHHADGSADNVIATASSTDGATLTFTVPSSGPSGILCDSANSCIAISAIQLSAGSYPVYVSNANGVSNTATFTITTGTTTPPVVTNPLTVTAPASNENWSIGSNHTVKWTGGTASTVNIRLNAQAGTSCPSGQMCAQVLATYYIAKNVPNNGSFVWQAQPTDVDGKAIPGGTYKVAVENAGTNEFAEGQGTVTTDATTYLQLVSPRDGGTWIKGVSQNVQFASNGIQSINVYLTAYYPCLYSAPACMLAQPKPYLIAQNVPTANSTIGIIPDHDLTDNRNIPAGQYMIQISDASGYFTDTSPKPITLQ